jgi:molybdopterin molybdotransferase
MPRIRLITGTAVASPLSEVNAMSAQISHGNEEPMPLAVAVLTVSDSRNEVDDISGRYLAERIVEAGHRLERRAIEIDDVYRIRARVSAWLVDPRVQVILVTGGTGLRDRDRTPEAIRPLLDREIAGFGELFRMVSVEEIGTSTLQSRAFAGLANQRLITCLPGSPSACRTAWERILKFQLDSRHQPCNLAQLLPAFPAWRDDRKTQHRGPSGPGVSRVEPLCDLPARSVDGAIADLLQRARPVREIETVAVSNARGRVLAEDLQADSDLPPFDNSAVDGYAFAASEMTNILAHGLRVNGRFAAGGLRGTLAPGCAARVFTGSWLPAGADRVAMQEDCMVDGDRVRILTAPRAGDNIRRRGEDVARGHVVLRRGTRLRAMDLALAAALGKAVLSVYRRPRIAILCTGDELIVPGQALSEGRIFDANGTLLTGLLDDPGFLVTEVHHVADDLASTVDALVGLATGADIVISTGGASVGEQDHLKAAVERCGRLEWWKVAIKPGKPFALGSIEGKPLLGLPGNPVSALITFCILVRPFLRRMQGMDDVLPSPFLLPARFDRHAGARREYLRVRIEGSGHEAGLVLAGPQGSGILSTAVRAQGLAMVPEGRGVREGEMLGYLPFDQLLS